MCTGISYTCWQIQRIRICEEHENQIVVLAAQKGESPLRRQTRITSVKPGRGPSFMGGIGSVIMVLFGLFWTAMAFQVTRGAPFGIGAVFPLFGILFVIMGIVSAAYNFRNATTDKRYSLMDITDSETEPDPLNERFGRGAVVSLPDDDRQDAQQIAGLGNGEAKDQPYRFCPYCGKELDLRFRFCPSCGKEMPE